MSVRHRRSPRGLTGLLAGLLLGSTSAAMAHEYWIAPEDHTVRQGERVEARLMVGEMLRGNELPWLSHQLRSFRVATPGEVRELDGMEGDLPAISYVTLEPGLHVIAVETLPLTVTFETLAEFRDYLDYEGLGEIAEDHLRRGLPAAGIVEAYARAAKSLVQVGPVRPGQSDRALGLPFELVALGNPYAGEDRIDVLLLWQGEVAPGRPVAVFRQNGETRREMLRTDARGRIEIALTPGTRYLLNAVHIEPAEGGEKHLWASTWASLSFASAPP